MLTLDYIVEKHFSEMMNRQNSDVVYITSKEISDDVIDVLKSSELFSVKSGVFSGISHKIVGGINKETKPVESTIYAIRKV